MKFLMHEVLQKVSNAKTKKEKIALLQQYDTRALRSIMIINFDDSVISLLPAGTPPYNANDVPENTEHTVLEKEARLLHHFFKGGSSVKQSKREMMFIQMLEGLHKGEAEVLCLAKDGTLGKRWKITKACVEEAYPQIQWGNRS